LALSDIARQVLPAGLFNVVTGAGAIGDALVRHPKIKRIALIGSVGIGRAIQRAAAEAAVKHVKRLSSAARIRWSCSQTWISGVFGTPANTAAPQSILPLQS
jgi:hypothetical protein